MFFISLYVSYIINLLHKFEVALTWDSKTLLIPSLLPMDESVAVNHIKVKVRLLI